MARLIPAEERITKARELIQQARDLPVPSGGKHDFSYIAQVKGLLQQARDLIKFISNSPSTTTEMKKDVQMVFIEAEQADRDILR